jgi:hypothetical protein
VTDRLVVLGKPVPGGRPSKVLELLEERPLGVEPGRCRERVEVMPAMKAVHEDPLVVLGRKLSLLDQPGHELDRPELVQQVGVERDLGQAALDLPRRARGGAALERIDLE